MVINFLYATVICFSRLGHCSLLSYRLAPVRQHRHYLGDVCHPAGPVNLVTMLFMSEHLYGFNVDQSINWKLLLGLSPAAVFFYLAVPGDYRCLSDPNMP